MGAGHVFYCTLRNRVFMVKDKKFLKVLVTGGAGYIGSATTAALIEEGHTVTVLDNLSSGHLQAVHPEAHFIKGDISDSNVIEDICRDGIDVAMHFAAFIEVEESITNPSKYYGNNLANTFQLLDNLRVSGVHNIVFSSTAAVYGEPESIPLTESSLLRPVNPYGWTKMMVEQLLRDYDQAFGLKSVSLRYFNAAGAYNRYGEDHRSESHLIPRILNAASDGASLQVYGIDYGTQDGSCIRDFVHVKDLADAHVLAAQHLCTGGSSDCFNLGTGKGFSILEVIGSVEKVVGRRIDYRITKRRKGDSAVLVASPQKAQCMLGWRKQFSTLEEIIESAWKWKRENPNGYIERL